MITSRRQFLKQSALAAGAAAFGGGCVGPRDVHKTTMLPSPADSVMTVLGPIAPSAMGATLPHEHIMLDFIGADKVSRDRYDRDTVIKAVLPYLQQLPDFGCRTLVECTPAYIGRDPLLLKRLALATELNLLTNTGYYGAAQNKFLPDDALTSPADELAQAWLREWRNGIEDTGVKPGFIKIGVDEGPLSNLHRDLVRAAARTHLASGLTIAAHSGDGRAAMEELSILESEGVSGAALIWVHAQNESDPILHWHAAEQGAWVEFDHISPSDIARHLELVVAMKERGYLHRVLVSHDAGWYEVGVPDGGKFRPYDTLFTQFIPALRQRGFTEQEISLLLVTNPRDAFTIRVRKG
jgi:phosphotriesterase-related protein